MGTVREDDLAPVLASFEVVLSPFFIKATGDCLDAYESRVTTSHQLIHVS